ncbi:14185_t:CDS:2 [Funneliformis geosporum]|nr:14185_t:CDS:2 [Funneliformis geosporum]
MVKTNVERVAKNGLKKESENEEYFAPVISIGGEGEEGGLIFSVGETTAEKAQREKKFKEEKEAAIKRSEEIEEITKRCEEIDKIGNNSEKEKHFTDKQGKLTITCSLEC